MQRPDTMPDAIGPAEFLQALFGPGTEELVYLSSLLNEPGAGTNEIRLVSREPAAIEAFVAKNDRPGRGLFFCVGTVKGPPRNKSTIVESIGLHADIDLANVQASEEEVRHAIRQRLRLQPSALVRSGHGLHAYWLFREGMPTQDARERLEAALRQLADLVAGDLSVCEVARLMRLPGTHNTKNGEWLEVVCEFLDGARYELEDLEEWLAESAPVLRRKIAPIKGGETVAPADDNPFLAAARAQGFKPPVDIGARLAAMTYGGVGDSGIHNTQLSVSASMLSAGVPAEEVVAILMDATARAAGEYGDRWNWNKEMVALHRMCATWLQKHPVERRPQPERLIRDRHTGTDGEHPKTEEEERSPPDEDVVDLEAARAQRGRRKYKPQSAPGSKKEAAFIVAEGVIGALRRAGEDILLAEGEVWLYVAGCWRVLTPADEQRIAVLIREGFDALKAPPRASTLSLAMRLIKEHPDLFMAEVPWAGGGTIVCRNGVLKLSARNGELAWDHAPHSPDHYARRAIGTDYIENVACPAFLGLLGSMFAGRRDAGAVIELLQEWAGAALALDYLSREGRKALLLLGPSRTGKTELTRVFRLLIGEPIAALSVAEISDTFGLQTLYGAVAWIRDDAINEGDKLDPQRFKTVVTGEPIDIRLMHRPSLRNVSLTIPVLLTTNSLPRARDVSDAIFNRSLVLEMTNVISEEAALAARKEMGVAPGQTPGTHIWDQEAAGILNWALAGLRRLVGRGYFDPPASVRSAVQRFKDSNNPVGEWVREAVDLQPYSKVSRADMLCSYHGWQREQEGDEARAIGGRLFWPHVRSLLPHLSYGQEDSGQRYVEGVALNEVGLRCWEQHNQGPQLRGGSKGSTLERSNVNKTHSGEGAEDDLEKPVRKERF